MSKVDSPRAFPSAAISDDFGGMSLRDWFAGMALAGMGTWCPTDPDGYAPANVHRAKAWWAFRMADAMLAKRSEGAGQGGDQ